MSTNQELEATIRIHHREEKQQEEEIYSQHINTQEVRPVQERKEEKMSYEMKLKELGLMPITKRYHRNILYSLASAVREELYIPFIETDQTSSQRLGIKIKSLTYRNKAHYSSKAPVNMCLTLFSAALKESIVGNWRIDKGRKVKFHCTVFNTPE